MSTTSRTLSLALTAVSAMLAITMSAPALAAPISSRTGAAMPAATTGTSAERLHHEVLVRTTFGLDASAAHVRRIDASADATTSELGIPLSPAESRRITRRDGFGEYADAITSAASSTPEFVQARVDELDLVVEIAAPSDQAADAIAAPLLTVVPSDVPVEVEAVQFTAAEVRTVQERVNRLTFADDRQLHIITSGQDVDMQHISIGIARDAPVGAEARVRALFPEPLVRIDRTDPVDFQSE